MNLIHIDQVSDQCESYLTLFEIVERYVVPSDDLCCSGLTVFHQTLASYLIHLAGSPPDTAEQPLYNMLPSLDDTNWDTLPNQLRQVSLMSRYRSTTNGLIRSEIYIIAVYL